MPQAARYKRRGGPCAGRAGARSGGPDATDSCARAWALDRGADDTAAAQ